MYPPSSRHGAFESASHLAKARSVFLKSDAFYQKHGITRVAPAPHNGHPNFPLESNIIQTLKPVLNSLRFFGIYPLNLIGPHFAVTLQWLIGSIFIYVLIAAFIIYIQWDNVKLVRSAEGRFEEAVIDYLFTVYLIPIILNPLVWYQAKRHSAVLEQIYTFEEFYGTVTNKKLDLCMGNKMFFIAFLVPLIGCGTMLITHLTMAHFHVVQVSCGPFLELR